MTLRYHNVMSRVREQLEAVYDDVRRRNPAEPEFHQAVGEVLHSIEPAIAAHPEYLEAKILQRLCEPERQLVFQVPWEDEGGEIHINRGFRVEFSSALGPYKGGLRFHPSVCLGVVKFLAFEQVLKNSLTGLQLGGGKGGSDFDPKGRSDREVMRFCQSFMTELYRHLGEDTDIPAGDIGVGTREDRVPLRPVQAHHQPLRVGHPDRQGVGWGGAPVRTEATGYGCVLFVRDMLAARGQSLDGRRVVVSGSGNVAIYAIDKAQQLGARVLACSDSTGYVVDEKGIDVELLRQVKEQDRRCLDVYAEARPDATFVPGRSVWEVPCEVALPSATQNEITAEAAASMVRYGCFAVGEGANMPTTPDAVRLFLEAGVAFAPARPPTPAASPPRPWRCSRTRPATPGPSPTPSGGWSRSSPASTTAACAPPTTAARQATTSSAPTSPPSPAWPTPCWPSAWSSRSGRDSLDRREGDNREH